MRYQILFVTCGAVAIVTSLYLLTSLLFTITCFLALIFFLSPCGMRFAANAAFRIRRNNNTLIVPFYLVALGCITAHFWICGLDAFRSVESSEGKIFWSDQGTDEYQKMYNLYKYGEKLTNKERAVNAMTLKNIPEHHCGRWFFIVLTTLPAAFIYNVFALRDELGRMIARVERRITERKEIDRDLSDIEERPLTATQGTPQQAPPQGDTQKSWGGAPITRRDFFSFEFLELLVGIAREFVSTSVGKGIKSWRV